MNKAAPIRFLAGLTGCPKPSHSNLPGALPATLFGQECRKYLKWEAHEKPLTELNDDDIHPHFKNSGNLNRSSVLIGEFWVHVCLCRLR